MRVTVTGPNRVANPRACPPSATPRRCPPASTTSTRRCSRTARRSRLSCNSCRSRPTPSVCSRSSNCAWVIPAAWSPVNHATNPSNRVDDAANAASAVSDAYPGIRLLLRKCSDVGTDEPTGKGATPQPRHAHQRQVTPQPRAPSEEPHPNRLPSGRLPCDVVGVTSDPDTVPVPDRRLVDLSVVRRLIAGQFPQWAHLPVRPVATSGWDNQ